MEAIFNGILEFESQDQLDEMLSKMDNTLAIKLLELALDSCTEYFTMTENHVLYLCLKKLKQIENNGRNITNAELQQSEGPSVS